MSNKKIAHNIAKNNGGDKSAKNYRCWLSLYICCCWFRLVYLRNFGFNCIHCCVRFASQCHNVIVPRPSTQVVYKFRVTLSRNMNSQLERKHRHITSNWSAANHGMKHCAVAISVQYCSRPINNIDFYFISTILFLFRFY